MGIGTLTIVGGGILGILPLRKLLGLKFIKYHLEPPINYFSRKYLSFNWDMGTIKVFKH